jgi:transcriptional regulator with XRE-family HTH domain
VKKLKELRTAAGLTQKQLAERLGTTQQTVARWESNQTGIPSASLRDIATLLGGSVDELLGVERRPLFTSAPLATPDHRVPFGRLTVNLGFASRQYPIDDGQRRSLSEALHSDFSLEGFKGWIAFTSLDNRLVLLNPALLTHLSLLNDKTEVMPFFVSPEAYRSLTVPTPADRISATVADERKRLIRHLAPREIDPQKALEEAQRELASLRVLFADGREVALYLSDEIAKGIELLQLYLKEVGPNAFVVGKDGPDNHLFNLSKVAAIEVPLEAYRAFLTKEGPDDG